MADHDKGATVRLAATIARSRYESDGGTLLDGIHPDTIVEMSLAAKREVDKLRADLAEARAENARLREAMPTEEEIDAIRDGIYADDRMTRRQLDDALKALAKVSDVREIVDAASAKEGP